MTTTTTVVSVKDVSKRFVIRKDKSLKERIVNFGRSNLHKDDFWALEGVSLDIESGSSVGLVGPNGSGKSTLLKTIGGIIQPTSGSVHLRGRLAALLELGAGFHPDLTGRENVYLNASILGLTRKQTDKYFDAIVDFSGIEPFIDTQVKFYSSGMYVRLAFAVAVHVDPDILLVDEVLAVGDEPFQRKCMDRIRGFQVEGRTIIFVSHSLDQVADLCDRAVVLEHGRVKADGPPLESLRVLRADFEQSRREDQAKMQATAEAADDAPPLTRTRVTSVAVSTAGRASGESVTIAPGTDVVVTVGVESDVPVDDAFIGIAVNNPLGQSVFGTNTRLMGVSLPPLIGSRSFEFRLPHVGLGEGSYTIDAAVSLPTGHEAHRLVEGAGLVVEASGRTVGYVHIEPEVVAL
ncbi:MAG: ABC transporter ATP-binding protein [Cellulomonadaceae bacterium]|nr:ABC transporter ATP-binding protein [Cellulomonadaceae bacterium]